MNISFIILAGGESKRFNSKTPKPYHLYKGKPLLMHSIDRVKSYKKFKKIVIVVHRITQNLLKNSKFQTLKLLKVAELELSQLSKG